VETGQTSINAVDSLNVDMAVARLYKKLVLISFFSVAGSVLFAQDVAQLKGRVLDGESGAPLPFASVFINNTSIGTTTDSSGYYLLRSVPTHYADLVFSFIGYESLLTKISLSPGAVVTVQAKLLPSKTLLKEMVVRGKRDKQWKKNFDRFIKEFFGTGPNASLCEISNAGILNFLEEKNGTILKASSESPLEIYNHALGYKIQISLKSYESTPSEFKVLFYAHFTGLQPANKQEMFRWQVGRVMSYKGSQRHFLSSLIDKRADQEGYKVYYNSGYSPDQNEFSRLRLVPVASDILFPKIVTDPKLRGYYHLLKNGTFEIHYLNKIASRAERWYPAFPHPVSWITVPNEFLLCPTNGIVRSNSDYVVSGSMNGYRVSDLLPEDFDPIPEEGAVYLSRYANPASIRGVVTDSASGRPMAGAHVFIDNSLYKTDTDSSGRFELKNVPQGVYELVTSYGEFPVYNQKVEVIKDSVAKVDIRLPAKKNTPWAQGPDGEKLKLMYFRKYWLGWPRSVTILNPYVLELKLSKNKIQLRATTSLELEDGRTGYRIHYYLKDAEFTHDRSAINGFTSFDTLSAKTLQENEKWKANRYEIYRGSINHFLKSLVAGRTTQEGFQLSTTNNAIQNGAPEGNHSKRRKTPGGPVEGDSLLTKSEGGAMFRLTIPVNTTIRFETGKPARVASTPGVQVSTLGILSDKNGLSLEGGMKGKPIPFLPLEYVPLNETISDPHVWQFVHQSGYAIKQLREKAHLHTDKGYYYPGEKVWFKAYMRYGSLEFQDSLSKVLYVELINPEKRVIRNKVLKVKDGVAWGDFALPDTLKPGNYFLRSYTRWALNFGDEDFFLQPIPVLPTDRNLKQIEKSNVQASSKSLGVIIYSSQRIYKPREKITLQIKINDTMRVATHSNLSLSVTDLGKVSRSVWVKSIVEDSIVVKKENWKYRLSYPVEKEFSYDCVVKKGRDASLSTVMISSVKDNKAAFCTPDKDARFKFIVDFQDTASFIFRANLTKGGFAGHVVIEKPYSPVLTLPTSPVQLAFRQDDVKERIKYSYDPSEKARFLDEVLIRGSKIKGEPDNVVRTNSITQMPSVVFEGQVLKNIAQSVQDGDGFMRVLVDRIPGARYDPIDRVFYLRRSPASFMVNNVPYNSLISVLNPAEIDRLEVYNNLALVNIYLKNRPDETAKPDEFDRYTLSGFSSPSPFYMRDYSQTNLDNAFPDLRTTIYWTPDLITKDGESTVTFYAADLPTKYRIVIEGLSDKGLPIYGEQIIMVDQN
jgi:hypothetical protein